MSRTTSLLIVYLIAAANALCIYSDEFSRNVMFPLSAAAYSDNPQMCLDKLFKNATVFNQVTVPCLNDKKNTCSGYTAVLHDQKAIIMSFRGTQSTSQLFAEIKGSVFSSWYKWSMGGKISKYFGDAFMSVWNGGMAYDLISLKTSYPEYEIWATGHSLGGSLASLAASIVLGSGLATSKQTKLMTFGQPRTGNYEFSEQQEEESDYIFRVIHWRDIVPHIPYIGYHHHRNEAFYEREMEPNKFKVCNVGEDDDCSNGLYISASVNDHTHYFGKQVSQYGIKGCV